MLLGVVAFGLNIIYLIMIAILDIMLQHSHSGVDHMGFLHKQRVALPKQELLGCGFSHRSWRSTRQYSSIHHPQDIFH